MASASRRCFASIILVTSTNGALSLSATRHTIISKKLANVGSLDVRVSAEDLAEIDDGNIRIHGARYPEEHMKRVGL